MKAMQKNELVAKNCHVLKGLSDRGKQRQGYTLLPLSKKNVFQKSSQNWIEIYCVF